MKIWTSPPVCLGGRSSKIAGRKVGNHSPHRIAKMIALSTGCDFNMLWKLKLV